MKPILTSVEDTDMYYDNMSVVLKRLKPAIGTEVYINRNAEYQFNEGFANAFEEQLEALTSVRMTQAEFDWKRKNQPWLPLDYLLWKRDSFRFKRDYIHFKSLDNGKIALKTIGPADEVCHYETPLLTIISALNGVNFLDNSRVEYDKNWQTWLRDDFEAMYAARVNLVDFGTRRRAGYETEDFVCQIGKKYQPTPGNNFGFRGTSNVHFAMKYDLKAFGTYPHKYIQYMMALYGPRICNDRGLFHWSDTFQAALGIALTDTVTTPVFMRDFTNYYARLFDGIRQDSGDPSETAEIAIKHYEKLGIDPLSKVIIFSDGLNAGQACMLTRKFSPRIKVTCGIGTSLTHNVGKLLPPMNHVIKAMSFDFGDGPVGVCKLSDVDGKSVGDPADVAVTKHICGIKKLTI